MDDFLAALNGAKGELDAWLECNNEAECRAAIRSVMGHGEWNKAQAAITLKVPMSGIPELDAMIRESRRLDMATAAMRDTTTPEWCLLKADALLDASEKEQMK